MHGRVYIQLCPEPGEALEGPGSVFDIAGIGTWNDTGGIGPDCFVEPAENPVAGHILVFVVACVYGSDGVCTL